MSDARRPDDHEHEPAPPEQDESQHELERTSRDATGGDAEAAATPEQREALAKDEDDSFGGGQ